MDQSIADIGSQNVTKILQSKGKLQSRRSQKSAPTDSHEPPQYEFQFMHTLGIIHQNNIEPALDVPTNDLQMKSFYFDNMVDDLQLMGQEEQSRMKAQRAKNIRI
ncbi:hypothetical protein Fot_05428 [Forsythia ovata]|uniref:Uncharacterized protein n=1 Tax=Forsythia ovata TaxID=205694 RepID=A0ABD1WQ29_9LAMI